VYERLSHSENGKNYKYIWKAKLPYKITIFFWLLELNAVLTKEDMIKKKLGWRPFLLFLL